MKHLPNRQHIVYSYLLRVFLKLGARDREALKRAHGFDDAQVDSMLWRSSPPPVLKLFVEHDFSKCFDLRGIAGFYLDKEGVWRLNLEPGRLLLPYYRGELIAGLMVFRHAGDEKPYALTSRGLPGGSKAFRPEADAA